MPAVADGAFTVLVFRRTLWYRHPELILALLAFVVPHVGFKDVPAGAQRRPGRGVHNIDTAARRAMYLFTWRTTVGDSMVEYIQTLLA